MWIYLFNAIAIPVYRFFIKNKKLFICIVALQLFLILAFRADTLGADMDNYIPGFQYIGKMDFGEMVSSLRPLGSAELVWPYYYENGYVVLNWIVSHLGLSFHALLVICAAINVSSISYFIYRYSKKPWLSFAIFSTLGFYASTFWVLRQTLALSMVLIAFCCLDRRKFLPGLLMFILALSFHRAAIIALPILILVCLKRGGNMTRKKFLYLFLSSMIVFALSGFIFNNIFFRVMDFLGKGYVGHDLEVNKKLFLYSGISILTLLFYDFRKIKDKVDSVACYGLIFSLYFVTFGLYSQELSRALAFYSIFLVILVPNIFVQYEKQKYLVIIEALVFVLMTVYMYFMIGDTAINPYIFYQGSVI